MSFFHNRNTKSFQAMETGKFENSFKRIFGMKELPWGSPVITNTKVCLQNNQGDLQQITANLD